MSGFNIDDGVYKVVDDNGDTVYKVDVKGKLWEEKYFLEQWMLEPEFMKAPPELQSFLKGRHKTLQKLLDN